MICGILLLIYPMKCFVKSTLHRLIRTIYFLNKLNIIHAVSNWAISFMLVNLHFKYYNK